MRAIEALDPRSSGWMKIANDVDAFCCRGSSVCPLAVVTAGVHGDEYEGPAAVAELAARLAPDRMAGSVIALPVANPFAFSAAQRITPEDGLNLARTFPGDPSGSITQQLAAHLFTELTAEADYLIDLHSGGVEYIFHPLAGFYGPPAADNPSFCAAVRMGLPVLWRLPETSGVLSHEAWKCGLTTVGAEYLGAGQLSAEGVRQYVAGALSCLALWGICPEETLLPAAGRVIQGDWQLASATGIFHSFCAAGAAVSAGQEIAQIRNPRGAVLESFVADTGGLLLAIRSKAYIRRGDWGVLVATNA
jgi:predicted deacylase